MRNPADIRALAPNGVELEKRIDAVIDHAAVFDKWPATAGVRGEPASVVRAVLDRYRKEGWRIGHVPDQRDGDYIQVEQP